MNTTPVEIIDIYMYKNTPPNDMVSLFKEIKEAYETNSFFENEMDLIVFQSFLEDLSEEDLYVSESEELFKAWEEIVDKIVLNE